jgi:DNA-binding HxlR family transcriptional regulator
MEHPRSCCPVACTLDIIGDKWTLLVVRDLLLGRSHFREFAASPERIATNILTDRLTRLVDHGLAEKFPSPEQPGREAYRLTDKGKTLGPVVKAIVKWGLEQLQGTAAMMTPSTSSATWHSISRL